MQCIDQGIHLLHTGASLNYLSHANRFTILIVGAIVTSAFTMVGFSCQNKESEAEMIKSDHDAISSILDKALLNENPKREFESSLKKIRAYASVDSAWISGSSLFVKYKQGGVVSWTIPPPVH